MPRPPQRISTTVIGSGFPEQLNSSALVVGPTGVTFGRNGTLYVNDTLYKRITAIPFAPFLPFSIGEGFPLSTGGSLNGPLGLALTPGGDLLAADGGDGNLVEVSPFGQQLGSKQIAPNGAGSLFGLAVSTGRLVALFRGRLGEPAERPPTTGLNLRAQAQPVPRASGAVPSTSSSFSPLIDYRTQTTTSTRGHRYPPSPVQSPVAE